MLNKLLQRKFIRYFSISMLGTLVIVVTSIANNVLTARLLGAEGKGMYVLLYSTIVIAISTVGLKLDLSQAYIRKNASFEEIVPCTLILTLLSGLVAVLLVSGIVYLVFDRVYTGVPVKLMIVAICMIPVLLMAQNLRALLNANYENIPQATVVQSSRSVLFLAIFSVAAVAGSATLEVAVWGIVTSIVGMLLIAFFMVHSRGPVRLSADRQLLGEMTRFSLKTHFGQLFKYLQYRFDVFLVAYFLTPAHVGVYSVALAISEILWRIPNVAGSVLLPRLVKAGDRRSARISARVNRIVFLFTAICVVPLAFAAKWVVWLMFGKEFVEAGPVIVVMLPGVLALTMFKLLVPNLVMMGRAWTFSFSVFLSVIVMVALDVVLIPGMGILGAGIASSIAYSVAGFVVLYSVVRMNDLPLAEYFNPMPEIRAALGMLRLRGS